MLAPLFLQTAAGTFDGHWAGAWSKKGVNISVEFDLDGGKGTFTSRPQAVLDYPLDSVRQGGKVLHFVLGGGMKFSGSADKGSLHGAFDDGDGGGTFILRRAKQTPFSYSVKEVRFGSKSSLLAGTLCVPKGTGPFPAIVLLHGSGPQTRWGTLRYAADFFARKGIASLCWDQRGSGDSGGKWYASNYTDLVDDAAAGVRLLQRQARVNPYEVGVYGHSQGGTITPLLATKLKNLAFVIAGAPIVGPVFEQDRHRVCNILKGQGLTSTDIEAAMKFYTQWLNVARTGEGRGEMEIETSKVKGEKWFDSVEPPGRESYIWSWYRGVGSTDTRPFWAHVKQPSLLLWGERDEIENVPEYELAADRQLRRAENNDFTLLLVPRARHELKVDSEPGAPFEWRRPAPGLYETLVGWIKLRFR